jgi:hypothetical protein
VLIRRIMGKYEPVPGGGGVVFQRNYPAWPAYAKELAALTQRGADMLFVYVGGDTTFNHVNQFWEMFDTPETDRRRIKVTYHPKADHTFYGLEPRRALFAEVLSWLITRYPR